MFTSVQLKQFDFQEIKEEVIIVKFKPISSRYSKDVYNCVFMKGNDFYDLANKVQLGLANWVEINYLANFVKFYNGQIINSI